MTIGLKIDIRNARMQLIADAIDAGATPGELLFYGATRPATGAAITTQTLVGTATFSQPCGTVASGNLTFAAITGGAAVGGVAITWARATDGDGEFVADFSVGAAGSGADIEIDDITPNAGIEILPTGTQVLRGGNA